MADGRRTRWVAHDVYFLDEGLGHAMFERFGAAGVALWHGFVAACKKNHIEGQTSWSSDVEALTVFGLPGMPLVDMDGEPFELKHWLDMLSDHKVIRRHVRGRRVKVTCTKWERWQRAARKSRKAEDQADRRAGAGGSDVASTSDAGGSEADTTGKPDPIKVPATSKEGQQNRRSEADYVGTESARNGHDVGPKGAQMTDTDTDTDTEVNLGSADAARKPGRDLLFEALCRECGIDWTSGLTKSERGEVNNAVKQLREVSATPSQVAAKCRAYRRKWPRVDLTPSAIVKHWSKVDGIAAVSSQATPSAYDPDEAEARFRALTQGGAA